MNTHTTHRKDLIILAGQSNAGGWPAVNLVDWPGRYQPTQTTASVAATLYTFGAPYTHGWEPVKPLLSQGSLLMALGVEAMHPGWSPAIANFCAGGSTCAQWSAGAGIFDAFAAWWPGTLAALTAPRLRGLIWYQGESDFTVDPTGASWIDPATGAPNIFTRFRATVSATLPIVVVRLPRTYIGSYPSAFATAQDGVVAATSRAAIVEHPTASFVDGTHLDPASYIATARLAVLALLSLQ